MKKKNLGKANSRTIPSSSLFFFLFLPFMLLGAVSCMDQGSSGRKGEKKDAFLSAQNPKNAPPSKEKKEGEQKPSGDSNQAKAGNSPIAEGVFLTSSSVEIRHIVDPFSGNYRSKVSLPKNFSGHLYISGLNITSLRDKFVSVRFKFGKELEPVTISATVGRAPGLTPQTDIEVLDLDMSAQPLFDDMRLLYDLYDYNTYASDDTPTSDTLDPGLYCRGLKLEHDSTFKGSATKTNCSEAGDRCLYAYAKVRDSGLYDASGLAVIPREPMVDLSGTDFSLSGSVEEEVDERNRNNLKKCLPDDGKVYSLLTGSHRRMSFVSGTSASLAALNDPILTIGTGTDLEQYYFKGPYLPQVASSWSIEGDAIFDQGSATPTGLFQTSLDGTVNGGIKSYLFPRSAKLSLESRRSHIAATSGPYDPRTVQELLASGDTGWMDGCNYRVTHFNEDTSEGVGSCNVSALIEIVVRDPSTNVESVVASTKEVKLQLVQPSLKDVNGEEVLFESFKSCSSSRTCGANECCFNKRCWSKELVSQCIEDSETAGGFEVGEICQSDLQCLSLCCNKNTGRCAVHNTNITPPVFCSKSAGESCVSNAWCRKEVVRECRSTRTGRTPLGQTTCALRCFNKLEHGECVQGRCIPPRDPDIPAFDPTNCADAVEPPSSI